MTDTEIRPETDDARSARSFCDEQAFALERMQLALDAGRTGIWDWNLLTGEVHIDERVRRLWGLPEGVPASFEIFRSALHPQDKKRTKEAVGVALDPTHEGDYEIEYRVIGQTDRIERWVSVRGRTFFEDGRAVRILGTARDITPRKQREQHVRVLLRELVHRSKNLLAVVQAMSRQTAAGSPSLEEFQRKFAARLQALSMAHDLLVSQDWRGASMRELVRAQLAYCMDVARGDLPARAKIDGPIIMLKPEAAQNIGLALHELATNALSYGGLSRPDGAVSLTWRFDDGRLNIEWRESGGPAVAMPPREGFGHKVIKRLVAQALDGTATLNFPPEGLIWTLSIPASYATVREASA
ncbi:sensor histidine kinase [Methylocystis sp. B8]|uniref:sensor histidine kinase n=1 Tax=Methylocystis sp. B8 TaxID=544938 RepID=UPI0010FE3A3F|nr:sensor histidine kinase [Methylocystis sp. B8]TLG78100.1 PAS domain S-box protein [Methylocystis sp. B8]